ncbi:unnamed protein product [Schistosoma mattheei]|uniref:Uncharacterized protein n=1 Tax=Schistosoma mattheei TaxID=31246 RepID=A0A183NKL5_9TREM|nr:unnamed protein product [Schistosoma mattheei]
MSGALTGLVDTEDPPQGVGKPDSKSVVHMDSSILREQVALTTFTLPTPPQHRQSMHDIEVAGLKSGWSYRNQSLSSQQILRERRSALANHNFDGERWFLLEKISFRVKIWWSKSAIN